MRVVVMVMISIAVALMLRTFANYGDGEEGVDEDAELRMVA